ncbi:MAG: TraR/DksA C4-type zinc finger protein [Terrimicrobiaceae bacterium]|nr:TraR/DksA C4-type zinc finger protein [Terrimicrobiaceae bacterium]
MKSSRPTANSKKPAAKPAKEAVKKPKTDAKKTDAKSIPVKSAPAPSQKLTPFLEKQRERLLILKDTLLDSMNGVARDSLRSRAEGSEASAFGMHQADAGSDAYDRDFALSLLSQEQDSLYEIDEALKRIENGSYGVCEMSGKPIPHARLEALPFTRYTVECQAELEKRNRFSRVRQPVTSLFGLNDEDGDSEEEESPTDTKD